MRRILDESCCESQLATGRVNERVYSSPDLDGRKIFGQAIAAPKKEAIPGTGITNRLEPLQVLMAGEPHRIK